MTRHGPQSTPPTSAAGAEHVVALWSGSHRWIFRWETGSEAVLIRRVAEIARDPAAALHWTDAVTVAKQIVRQIPRSSNSNPHTITSMARHEAVDPS